MTSRAGIPIAVALLVRDGRALLGHRHPARVNYPDCWDLVGGHVEPGESPHEAVVRECREEIGVTVLDATPIPLGFSDPGLDVTAFLVRAWEGEVTNQAPDEHDDLRWFTAEEITRLRLADGAVRDGIRAATVAKRSLTERSPVRTAPWPAALRPPAPPPSMSRSTGDE